MTAPPTVPPVASGLLGLLYLVVLAAVLAPWGALPAGYDAYWNLLVARTWTESGFPDAMPAAGFTQLAEAFGDRQLLFHGLLSVVDRAFGLDERTASPVLWGLVAAQGLVLWLTLRAWHRSGGGGRWGVWLVLLPALSQTWMFRTTLLRNMLLGVLFLLPLVALAAHRAAHRSATPPSRRGAFGLAALAAGFAYSHGAVVLPLVLWGAVAVGGRLDTGRWRIGDGGWIAGGIALACLARPDLPGYFGVLKTLNVDMLFANMRGEVGFVPAEFSGLGWNNLLTIEWPYLLALGALAWTGWRRMLPWSLWLPVACCAVVALAGSRMFELAAPFLVLGLGAAWGPRLGPWPSWTLGAAAVAVAWIAHLPRASGDAEAGRLAPLQVAGEWLADRARPGDTVFVTDWGASSPLAWFSRSTDLRFTGVIDPIFMWSHDRAAWDDWRAIKEARAEDPVALVESRFGARFVAVHVLDHAPGAPRSTTANYLSEAMRLRAARQPLAVLITPRPDQRLFPGNWWIYDLAP